MSDFELRRALKDLPRERDPRADLWPGIAARLGAQQAPAAAPVRRQSPRWLAIAATVAVALGATWLGLRTQPAGDAPRAAASDREGTYPGDYMAAFREAFRVLENRIKALAGTVACINDCGC